MLFLRLCKAGLVRQEHRRPRFRSSSGILVYLLNVAINIGFTSMRLISSGQRYFYLTIANSLFLIHTAFAILVLVGWAIPSVSYIYFPVLIASLVSELVLGHCVLTRWEFDIRKRLYPTLHYEHSFLIHYGSRLLRIESSEKSSKKSTKCGGYAFVLQGSGRCRCRAGSVARARINSFWLQKGSQGAVSPAAPFSPLNQRL